LINVPPDEPRIHEILGFFSHLLNRSFDPPKRIHIETINGDPAGRTGYADVLKTLYDAVVEFNRISLYRRIE
jgi:ATP-dependent Lhr-like helicase